MASKKRKNNTKRLQDALKKAREHNALKMLVQNDFDLEILNDFELLHAISNPSSEFYKNVCDLLEDREKALQLISSDILLDSIILLKKQSENASGQTLSAVEKIVRLIFDILKIQIAPDSKEDSGDTTSKGGVMIVQEFPSPEKWEEIARKQQLRLISKSEET